MEAARTSGVDVSRYRVCQVAGPILHGESGGAWNSREWLPTSFASSKKLGLGLVLEKEGDWVPMNVMARIMMDLFLTAVVKSLMDAEPDFTKSHGTGVYSRAPHRSKFWADACSTSPIPKPQHGQMHCCP